MPPAAANLNRRSNVAVAKMESSLALPSGIQHILAKHGIHDCINSPADDGCVKVLASALVEVDANAASSSNLKRRIKRPERCCKHVGHAVPAAVADRVHLCNTQRLVVPAAAKEAAPAAAASCERAVLTAPFLLM
jgi:hypothetical protein